MHTQLTAIIEREAQGYVAFCPELDIASHGDTLEEARTNLQEALELVFETASPEEIKQRLHEDASGATPALCMWEPTTTPAPSPWPQSGAGDVGRVDACIRARKRC